MATEKTLCRTPRPGSKAKHIEQNKFDFVRKAILRVVPRNGNGVPFGELATMVKKQLTRAELDSLGSVSWYATTVKLELEVRGDIRRVPGAVPQRLIRA
jgi:hypothetical protein